MTDVYCYADPTKLSWDIAHTSYFSRDVWTKCHVFDTTGWDDIVGPAVQIVADLKVDLNTDIEAHYITLEDAKGCPAVFKREFQEGVSSTVCFPFSFTPPDGMGTFYEFTSVNSERTEVTMTTVATSPLQANKPYPDFGGFNISVR